MLPLSVRGFIRFDVEDFLTEESDGALSQMWESMQRLQMPGSYGLVGKKVLTLYEHGHSAMLDRLRKEPSLGFHSTSHSEHPTLAEDLANLSYQEALERFQEREGRGVRWVAEYIKAPTYFTQPGGNWVPEAAEALPSLGMDVFFTDSFNSYVIDLPVPYWYGEVLHLSFPVVNPRPFGLGLPGNVDEAVEMVERWQHHRSGDAFMVMLHPTELVTEKFWDAVNFSGGRTEVPLRAAPVRSPKDQADALKAFDRYLERIRHLNVEWCDVASLKTKLAPRGPVVVAQDALLRAIGSTGWGPLEVPGGTLSAAEALYALAQFFDVPDAVLTVGTVGAPEQWKPMTSRVIPLSRDRVRAYARSLRQTVDRTGRLPSGLVAGLTLEQGMAALTGSTRLPELSFLSYIKNTPALHWNWPVFPSGFQPWRLWHDARRLAWTLKRARFRDEMTR